MTKLFGTDGIRGKANAYPIIPPVLTGLACAAGHYFKKQSENKNLTVIIAKDTRLSGYMIESALESGFISQGVNVILTGPLPTPAVSILVQSLRADFGVMVTASHNPAHDNGIKFFDHQGQKLSSDTQKEIESILENKTYGYSPHLGKAKHLNDAVGRYIEYCKATLPKKLDFKGLKVVLDCANGATYKVAPKVFWELGADVSVIGNAPDGLNINKDCGATHIKALRQKILEEKANIGLAFDGDGDRLICVDERGNTLDGDKLLAAFATYTNSQNSNVVATVMSNLGLENYLKGKRVSLFRSKVGDQYVAKMMKEKNCLIGGEQSGHLIFGNHCPTGDGIIAALQILRLLKENDLIASDLNNLFTPYPQTLENIRLPESPLSMEDLEKI